MHNMTNNFHDYDELYAVSDLHMGGYEGTYNNDLRDYRIFREGSALAWFINDLKSKKHKRVALVLNGDVVDFLADRRAAYFDTNGALQKLVDIMNDPHFKMVWEALREFVKADIGHLVIVLGNHDVELALPPLQEHLTTYLTGNNTSLRKNIIMVMDGTGFRCTVGGADVLCGHGNGVDNFNVVDYAALRDISYAMKHGQPIPAWEPNAGTTLVIDVMNKLKRKWQWVDLLKPETDTVPAVAVALDESIRDKLGAGLDIGFKWAREIVSEKKYLSDTGHRTGQPDTADNSTLNRDESIEYRARRIQETKRRTEEQAKKLIEQAEKWLEDGVSPVHLIKTDPTGKLISPLQIFKGIFGIGDRKADLRTALTKDIRFNTSFSPTAPDDVFKKIDNHVGSDIDFVLAGHTHFHKSLDRENGTGFYLNSGTWIPLIELNAELLENDAFYDELWTRLENGAFEKLNEPIRVDNTTHKLIEVKRTVVSVVAGSSGEVRGRLNTVESTAPAKPSSKRNIKNSPFELKPVPKTRKTWRP